MREMRGMVGGASVRTIGIILSLQTEIGLGRSDLPVAMSPWPVFLVELKVVAVAGISRVSAPDLQARTRITSEEPDGRRITCAIELPGFLPTTPVERPDNLTTFQIWGDMRITST